MAIDIPATVVALKDVRKDLDRFETSLGRLQTAAGPDIASLLLVEDSFSQVVSVIERMEALFGAVGESEASTAPMKAAQPSEAATAALPRSERPQRSLRRVKLTEAKMRAALEATGGIKSRAAAKLGVTPVTFRKYELQFGMAQPQTRRTATESPSMTARARESAPDPTRRTGPAD